MGLGAWCSTIKTLIIYISSSLCCYDCLNWIRVSLSVVCSFIINKGTICVKLLIITWNDQYHGSRMMEDKVSVSSCYKILTFVRVFFFYWLLLHVVRFCGWNMFVWSMSKWLVPSNSVNDFYYCYWTLLMEKTDDWESRLLG